MVLAGLVTTTISQSGLLGNLVQTKTKTEGKTWTEAETKHNTIKERGRKRKGKVWSFVIPTSLPFPY